MMPAFQRASTLAFMNIMALWFGLFLWSAPQATALDVASSVHESVLSNGLKVLLVEAPKAPVVTVQIWYKVGSRNEVMGRAGLSHMLEHMMFKGTDRKSTRLNSSHPSISYAVFCLKKKKKKTKIKTTDNKK